MAYLGLWHPTAYGQTQFVQTVFGNVSKLPSIWNEIASENFIVQALQFGDLQSRLSQRSPRQFEKLCAGILIELELTNVQCPFRSSGDGGSDGTAQLPFGGTLLFQSKRWTDPVGPGPVRELIGTVKVYGADCGMLVTGSHFTDGAIDLLRSQQSNLLLIDRIQLFNLIGKIMKKRNISMPERNIGLSNQEFRQKVHERFEEFLLELQSHVP